MSIFLARELTKYLFVHLYHCCSSKTSYSRAVGFQRDQVKGVVTSRPHFGGTLAVKASGHGGDQQSSRRRS